MHPDVVVPKDARPIPSFPGYVISRRGEIFSYWRAVYGKAGGKGVIVGMEIGATPKNVACQYRRGIKQVNLRFGDAYHTKSVRSLIDEVFHERFG